MFNRAFPIVRQHTAGTRLISLLGNRPILCRRFLVNRKHRHQHHNEHKNDLQYNQQRPRSMRSESSSIQDFASLLNEVSRIT